MNKSATITKVQVSVFTTQAHTIKDNHVDDSGRSEAKLALLSITDSDGDVGYVTGPVGDFRQEQLDNLLTPFLVGREVFGLEAILRDLYRLQRGKFVLLPDRTLNRVDQALWDLQGRKLQLPVWRMLGGARPKVPAYASTMLADTSPDGLSSPKAFADFAVSLVEKGYTAVKLHSWRTPPPGMTSVTSEIALCTAVREAVGPTIELMLDGFHWHSRVDALRVGRALEELDYSWIEEPMAEESMSSYQWLTEQLRIPVLGPESMGGRSHTRAEWIKSGACDLLRVSPLNAGGITPCIKTLHLADSFGMNCEVHSAGPASLALVAAMETSKFYERGLLHPKIDRDWVPPHLKSNHDVMDKEGFVAAPEIAGLGEDLDLDYIAAHTIATF